MVSSVMSLVVDVLHLHAGRGGDLGQVDGNHPRPGRRVPSDVNLGRTLFLKIMYALFGLSFCPLYYSGPPRAGVVG